MKTIINLILILSILNSCVQQNNEDTVTISKMEYKKLIGDTIISEYPIPFKFENNELNSWNFYIILGEDKHEYLTNKVNGNSLILIHYPDCKKCKKDSTCKN